VERREEEKKEEEQIVPLEEPAELQDKRVLKDLLQLRLFPLLFNTEVIADDLWKDHALFGDSVWTELTTINKILVGRKAKRFSEALGIEPMTPKEQLTLPSFDLHCIDRNSAICIEGIVRDLITLDQASTNRDLLTARMSNEKKVSLIRIPRSGNVQK
jgi:hypothetical protein